MCLFDLRASSALRHWAVRDLRLWAGLREDDRYAPQRQSCTDETGDPKSGPSPETIKTGSGARQHWKSPPMSVPVCLSLSDIAAAARKASIIQHRLEAALPPTRMTRLSSLPVAVFTGNIATAFDRRPVFAKRMIYRSPLTACRILLTRRPFRTETIASHVQHESRSDRRFGETRSRARRTG